MNLINYISRFTILSHFILFFRILVDAALAAGVKQATVRKDKKQAIELANEMRMSFCNNGPDSTAK